MKAENLEMMPRRSTMMSAGYDIYSPEEYELTPGQWVRIDTGVSLTDTEYPYLMHQGRPIPDDGYPHTVQITYPTRWWLDVRPRSSLASKYGLCFRGGPPVIDQDYRGNIILTVGVEEPYTLKKGERFAQAIFVPNLVMSMEITPTEQRLGGFGSTGRM